MIRFILFVVLTVISFVIAQEAIVNNAILEILVRFAAIVCCFYGAKMVWLPSKPRRRKLRRWMPGLKGLLLLAAAAMAPMPAEAGVVEENVAQGMEQALEALKSWPDQSQIRWDDLHRMEVVHVDEELASVEADAEGSTLGYAQCHLPRPRVTILHQALVEAAEISDAQLGGLVTWTAIHETVHVAVGCVHSHGGLFQDVMTHVMGMSEAGLWPSDCEYWTLVGREFPQEVTTRSCISRSWHASRGLTLHRDFNPREDSRKWILLILLLGVLMATPSAVEGLHAHNKAGDVRLDMAVLFGVTLVALGALLLSSLVDFLSLGGNSWAQEMASSLASRADDPLVAVWMVLMAQSLCASGLTLSGLALRTVRLIPKFALPVIVFLASSPAFGQTILLPGAEGVDMSILQVIVLAIFAIFAAAWIVSKTVGVQMRGVGLHGLLFPPRVRRWVRIRRRRGTGRVRAPRGVEAVLLPVGGVFGRVYADRWGWQWRQPPVLWTGGTWDPTGGQLGAMVALVVVVGAVAFAGQAQGEVAMAMAAGPLLDRLVSRLVFGEFVLADEYRAEEDEITKLLNQFDAFEYEMSLGEVIAGRGDQPGMDMWEDRFISCHAYSRDMFELAPRSSLFAKVQAYPTSKKTVLTLSTSKIAGSGPDQKTFSIKFAADICSLGAEIYKRSTGWAREVEAKLVGLGAHRSVMLSEPEVVIPAAGVNSWAKTPGFSSEDLRSLISDFSTLIGPAGADALAERFRAEVERQYTPDAGEEELRAPYKGLLDKMGFSSEELLRHLADDRSCLPWTPVTLWHGGRSLFWMDGSQGLVSYLMVVEPDEKYFVKAIPEWAPEGAYWCPEDGGLYCRNDFALHPPMTDARREELVAQAQDFAASTEGRREEEANAEYWRRRHPEEMAAAAQVEANMESLAEEVNGLYRQGRLGDVNGLLGWVGFDCLKVREDVAFVDFLQGHDRGMTEAHRDENGGMAKLTPDRWLKLFGKRTAPAVARYRVITAAMSLHDEAQAAMEAEELGLACSKLDEAIEKLKEAQEMGTNLSWVRRQFGEVPKLAALQATRVSWLELLGKTLAVLAIIIACIGGEEGVAMAGMAPSLLGKLIWEIKHSDYLLDPEASAMKNPTTISPRDILVPLSAECAEAQLQELAIEHPPSDLEAMAGSDLRDVILSSRCPRGRSRGDLGFTLATIASEVIRLRVSGDSRIAVWDVRGDGRPDAYEKIESGLFNEIHFRFRPEIRELAVRLIHAIETWRSHVPPEKLTTEWLYIGAEFPQGFFSDLDEIIWPEAQAHMRRQVERDLDGEGRHRFYFDVYDEDWEVHRFGPAMEGDLWGYEGWASPDRAPGNPLDRCHDIAGGWGGVSDLDIQAMDLGNLRFEDWLLVGGADRSKYPLEHHAPAAPRLDGDVVLVNGLSDPCWRPRSKAQCVGGDWSGDAVSVLLLGWKPDAPCDSSRWRKIWDKIAERTAPAREVMLEIRRKISKLRRAHEAQHRQVGAFAALGWEGNAPRAPLDSDRGLLCEECFDPDTVDSDGEGEPFRCEGSWSGPALAEALDGGGVLQLSSSYRSLRSIWESAGGGMDPIAQDPTLGWTEEDWEKDGRERLWAGAEQAVALEAGSRGSKSFEEWQVSGNRPRQAARGSFSPGLKALAETLAEDHASLYRGGRMQELNRLLESRHLGHLKVRIIPTEDLSGFRRGYCSAALEVHGEADLERASGWVELLMK